MTLIFSATAVFFLVVNLWALRRYSRASWSRILAGLGVLVMFDILAITSVFFITGFVLIFIGLEEVSKFAASKLIDLHRPIVRLLVGFAFGLCEIVLSKSLYIATGRVELKDLGIFAAFCFMAVIMHGVTALYYTVARNAFWGLLAATSIHALYNWVADQAETIGVSSMALINSALLLLALAVYLALFWRDDLARPRVTNGS